MNLKLIYGLIFGFFGFIVSFFLAACLYGFLSAFLWVFVLKEDAWPHWILVGLLVVFFLTFLSVMVKSISMGLKKGEQLDYEEEYREEIQSKAKLLLKVSIFSLLVSVSFLTFKADSFYKKNIAGKKIDNLEYKKIVGDLQEVSAIEVLQMEKAIDIVVSVNGKTNDKYELKVQLFALGPQQDKLVEFSKTVSFFYDQQKFYFPLSFASLAKEYNEYFSQYVPQSNKRIGVDAFIKVVGTLTLFETDRYNSELLRKYSIPQSRMSTTIRLFFSCKEGQCEVSQFDNSSKIPTEIIHNKDKKL